MAVDVSLPGTATGNYGPIEPLTLPVLREELEKLQGTLTGDITMGYERCLSISDEFIDELGQCLGLSVEKYPRDKDLYLRIFDGLQEIINLMHGVKQGLLGSDGQPRVMDAQESRAAASDRLSEIMEEIAIELARREATRSVSTPPPEPRPRPRPSGASQS